MNKYFRSIIEQDRCAVVICNLKHEIIYMNPAAVKRYARRGGKKLVGQSLLGCHNEKSCEMIHEVLDWFKESTKNNIMYAYHNDKQNKDAYIVALRDEDGTLIGYYEKHEFRDAEKGEAYHFS